MTHRRGFNRSTKTQVLLVVVGVGVGKLTYAVIGQGPAQQEEPE